MTTAAWVILAVAIVAIAIAGLMAWKMRHTKELRNKFGPEYDHLVQERGSAARAEKELEYRAKRVEKLHIRPLTREECGRFAAQWRAAQERFVDDPRGSVADADRLVHEAMKLRGYPLAGEFQEREGDLSVDHPIVVEHYRAAHAIAMRDGRGQATTEDLRTAMKHYRTLFEDLLDERVTAYGGARR
jgi:hypothetical protein